MDESLIKAEKDYSSTLDKELPEVERQAKTNFSAAFDRLLLWEKRARQASDLASSKRVLKLVIDLCAQSNNWELMNEQITTLTKKHGQMKQAIVVLIQEAIAVINEDKAAGLDTETKISVIETIRQVTEGKIFVEVERARVSRTLAHIKDAQGNVDAATEILGELQVETYGSMDMREKTEFILEQVHLYIRKGDFVQALIVSRKIVPRYFNNKEVDDLKLKYYDLMIQIGLHDGNYLDVCQYYRHVYETDSVHEDATKWKPVLENIVLFIILAPFDNLQSDLIHKIELDPRIEQISFYQELIKCFTANELMRWPKIDEIYGPELKHHSVFDVKTSYGKTRWDDLRKRVIEHNIRVIAKYYMRITTSRLMDLLDLPERETEEFLSKMVTQGTIYARINRPERVVTFAKPKDPNDVLNEWGANISTLLSHIETIGHLITKEEMMSRMKQ